jgi:glycyl-tRNA synthetase beta chain
MPEFFLELFSEEIPASMQERAAEFLYKAVVTEALSALQPSPASPPMFWGPRRIAIAAHVNAEVPASERVERGPRIGAPEAAVQGFLRKHGARPEDLQEEGEYFVLRRRIPGKPATELIAAELPKVLWRFSWPKSMRWGESQLLWVRPLRRILCLLDGELVRFALRQGDDEAHGLASGNETEGHRFMAPGAVAVRSAADWQARLYDRFVMADAKERRARIAQGLNAAAAQRGFALEPDEGLLDEVTGLVEWPVVLIGRIDPAFMDLPPEVMRVSMRMHQRYFALRDASGRAAPAFAFVANTEAPDGGAAIIAGNERVLRARFSDARHLWDQDRKVRLESRVEKLKSMVFHAKLGTQYERAERLKRLAGRIAGAIGADPALAERAGWLAKADLTTGMVGEFPELQGVMGYYYALHDGESPLVAAAIRDHYLPKGAADAVPTEPLSIAVALADRIDQLAGFFGIGEAPTGAGDPYALRRAALGVIRMIRENRLRLALRPLIAAAGHKLTEETISSLVGFILERLRVQLREEGMRHDVVAAAIAASEGVDDILWLAERARVVADLLGSETGVDLLTAYRRAANILRIEEKKDGCSYAGTPDPALFRLEEEKNLNAALAEAQEAIAEAKHAGRSMDEVRAMAGLREPIDAFFAKVTVNAPEPELRHNRLKLLSRIRDTMNRFANFSRIEG